MLQARSILICVWHMRDGYSGGRYHAWMLGEALAASGHKVTVWTGYRPVYVDDFVTSPGHGNIKIFEDPEFQCHPPEKFDWVFIVPDMNTSRQTFVKWLTVALKSSAKVGLINFESPNFFNAFSTIKKNPDLWENWTFISRYSDVIISST